MYGRDNMENFKAEKLQTVQANAKWKLGPTEICYARNSRGLLLVFDPVLSQRSARGFDDTNEEDGEHPVEA